MMTDSASMTNRPPMMASTISCLVATAIVPIRPPSASEPVSPMKIAAGGALNQRKPRPGADDRAEDHGELAGAGHEMDLQIFGEDRVAGQIGDDAEGGGGDHDRHDGQPVEAVGQVHRVAGADDDDAGEGDEEPAEIEQEVLDEGKGQRRGERRLAGAHDHPGGDAGDHELDRQPRLAGEAEMRLLGDLQVVVVEADRAEAERDQQHDPDIDAGEVGPQQRRADDAATGSSARPWSACRPS